jgi:predicted nucleic acid-binding Zn ribbon protein
VPTYDYKCNTCEQTITIAAGIEEEVETPICVKCKEGMARDYNFRSFKFNGKGFYSTDK